MIARWEEKVDKQMMKSDMGDGGGQTAILSVIYYLSSSFSQSFDIKLKLTIPFPAKIFSVQ